MPVAARKTDLAVRLSASQACSTALTHDLFEAFRGLDHCPSPLAESVEPRRCRASKVLLLSYEHARRFLPHGADPEVAVALVATGGELGLFLLSPRRSEFFIPVGPVLGRLYRAFLCVYSEMY